MLLGKHVCQHRTCWARYLYLPAKREVTGTVEDDFGPVTGASVVVKGTTNGTITDMDGNFTLEGVKNGDVIQISFIGYSTMEITYTGQPVGVIKLAEDTQKLDEVVVTALGIKREKKALGYATQELKGDELVNARKVILRMHYLVKYRVCR